jgi:DNA-binding CsgD family transcriptional regulator
MEYYRKAGEIFDKYGWNESNAILYYNIGETWVDEGDFPAAEKAYLRSLDYGTAADDSLMVAMARKGLGRLYMEKGRTWKSLRYLHAAEEYYSAHEREEVGFAKENYEYMSAALLAQRKTLMLLVAGAVALLLLTGGVLLLAGKLRVSRKEHSEVAEVLEETLQEIRPAVAVSAREHEILDLLSKGYTTPQIAEGLHLSPETVKWYRKKLLVKFDVANAAELVTKAREGGAI